MTTVEELVAIFESIPPASGNEWDVKPLVADRLHLSRGPAGEFVIFVEGERETFGLLPKLAGQHHNPSVADAESGRVFPALRLSSPTTPHANRSMAHVAYELARKLEASPGLSNEELFSEIGWVLVLLGAHHGLLSMERQKGLAGECFLLRDLLVQARQQGVGPHVVLQRWWGHDTSKRDFSAQGIAIEVKTTGNDERLHQINDMHQLDPQDPSEKLYLYSIGLKFDPTGPIKLPTAIQNVVDQLVHADGSPHIEARSLFQAQLSRYGYREAHAEYYAASPGFLAPHLTGRLFSEAGLPRLRMSDFVGAELPTGVAQIGYVLRVEAEPLTDEAASYVFAELLKAPPSSLQEPDG